MKYPVVRCQPESLRLPVEGTDQTIAGPVKIQLMQGGLELAKPTILFELDGPAGPIHFRCYVEELRMALDFLEPAPKKRVRPPKPKKAAKLATVLGQVVSKPEDHHG